MYKTNRELSQPWDRGEEGPGGGQRGREQLVLEGGDAAEDLITKYRKKLDEHIELARTCKRIAALQTEMELGFNLQDIRFKI